MLERWITRGAVVLLMTGACEVLSQPAPTASTAPAALAQARNAPVGDLPVVLMRTAGQADRQLKVLKLSNYADGESIAEVQDVVSGQIFTLPGKVVATLPKANGASTPPLVVAPISEPVVAPVPVTPPVAPTVQAPQAPLPVPKIVVPATPVIEQPAPKVTFIPAPPAEEIPAPAVRIEPKILPTPVVVSTPIAPMTPGASLVWRPRAVETPALTPSPILAPAEPSKGDRWQPTKRMQSSILESFAPTKIIARGTHATGYDDEPAVRMLRPDVVEERDEVTPVGYSAIELRIRNETQGYVYDLAAALRPSIRENAAICLAESRYGWRQEVKGVLAKAAVADPAPSVRAKCIQLLMQLGYHDPDYMAFLKSTTNPGDAPTMVKSAAKEALAKLTPRAY